MFDDISRHRRKWKYKNLTFLFASLVIFVLLLQSPAVDRLLSNLGEFGYISAFITGIFFVSTFTVAPAVVVLIHLTDSLSPLYVAFFAGLGGAVGDILMMKFIKDQLFEEIKPLFIHVKMRRLKHLLHTPYFAWMIPILGCIFIAGPFPDEVGVALLGIKNKVSLKMFGLLSILNFIGILAFVFLFD